MARTQLRSHPKFRRLVRTLGLPAPYVTGLLETMWHVGYESANSMLGQPDDVELSAEWPGKPGEFFEAIKADWLDEVNGQWHIHNLHKHAPTYVKKKLERRNKDLHSKMESIGCQTDTNGHMTQTQTQTRLSADADRPEQTENTSKPQKPPKKEPTGLHHEFIQEFCKRWQAKYGGEFPFEGPRDGAIVKKLLKHVNDIRQGQTIIERYFSDPDPWLCRDHHGFGLLLSNVRRYLAPASKSLEKVRIRQ